MSTAISLPEFDERERAKGLIRDIGGDCWRGRGDMIDRVYAAVRRAYPREAWTRRRIRALWHGEVAGVRWAEMQELEVVAGLERRRRAVHEEARRDHADFIAHISATLDHLETTDAEFYRRHRDALRAVAGGQDDPQVGKAAGAGDLPAATRGGDITETDQ